MFVTTSIVPLPEQVQRAEELAQQFQCTYVPRRKMGMNRMFQDLQENACLVVERSELRYLSDDQPPMFYHPSSGMLRIKRLEKGETDALVEIAQIQAGDRILDATCGLGSDAFVLQYAATLDGQVTALESSAIVAEIVSSGMQNYHPLTPAQSAVLRKINVIHINYLDFLRNTADKSFDVVYFDPMFHQAVHESVHLQPLRGLANHQRLSVEAVQEACRVAKRCVILKDHSSSPLFESLGFEAPVRKWTDVRYGRIQTQVEGPMEVLDTWINCH